VRVDRAGAAGPVPGGPAPGPAGGFEGFEGVFRRQREALRLSAHAEERLRAAGADAGRMAAAAEAVGRAAARGGRSTLVLMDGMALVVDVPTRTVVTAVSAERMRDRVFTQIDSAVIA
jgi:flagellar operon protein